MRHQSLNYYNKTIPNHFCCYPRAAKSASSSCTRAVGGGMGSFSFHFGETLCTCSEAPRPLQARTVKLKPRNEQTRCVAALLFQLSLPLSLPPFPADPLIARPPLLRPAGRAVGIATLLPASLGSPLVSSRRCGAIGVILWLPSPLCSAALSVALVRRLAAPRGPRLRLSIWAAGGTDCGAAGGGAGRIRCVTLPLGPL